ncbi:MAG: Rpn family recombination-promoting nuclease/putative transposase [Lachnospiraceae bacterium]|nr:Rpn family recombination-promoting nuclease/putative transposase [Lachnospiraceae bacterium]
MILDAKCVLGDGRKTDIEVKKANDTDHQRRVLYNGAILTTNLTDPGEKFENIPNVCVVFISRFDIFDGNHSLYHVDRIIRETGKVVYNGFEEVYVNAKVKDGSEVSELMEVFVDDAAYNSKFPVTSGSKRRYKTTEEGQQVMCEIMERIAKEERNEGRLEGETRINTLNSILINLNRFDDLKRAATDKDFQMQLMIELLPENM